MRVSLCPSGEKILNGKYLGKNELLAAHPSEAFVPPARKIVAPWVN